MRIQVAPALTLAGGSLIFGCFLVLAFIAVVFGYYTRRGSGINQRPYRDPASGPEKPSELAHDITEDVGNWDRGVGAHRRQRPGGLPADLSDAELRAALQAWRNWTGSTTLGQLDDSTPARGPDTGAEVIVFWDYFAPGASTLAAGLNALRKMKPVREAALHLPLADARPLSFVAALAVEAGRAQGGFWAVHDKLLLRRPKDEDAVFAAGELVEDPDRFVADVQSQIGRERILDHIRFASASGVRSVPTVFIAGIRYEGEHDPQALASAIDAPAARHWERRISPSGAPEGRASA